MTATTDRDYRDGATANRNRAVKVAALVVWCRARALTPSDIAGFDPRTAAKAAKAAGVNAPSAESPVWGLVAERLDRPAPGPVEYTAREEWLPPAPTVEAAPAVPLAQGRAVGRCGWCQGPVRWVEGPGGTPIALDPDQAPAGAVTVEPGTLRGRIASDTDPAGHRWHPHAATCPQRPSAKAARTGLGARRCDICLDVVEDVALIGIDGNPYGHSTHPSCDPTQPRHPGVRLRAATPADLARAQRSWERRKIRPR